MSGKTIVGIALLDGGVEPPSNGGMVSLRMVLFNYFKMEDKVSVFAKLHQTKELGPVLAIIPTCKEAEPVVHMMNKQVSAFLYYFLKDATLPKRFLMIFLCETYDAMLVAETSNNATGTRTCKPSPPHARESRITMPRTLRLKLGRRKPLT